MEVMCVEMISYTSIHEFDLKFLLESLPVLETNGVANTPSSAQWLASSPTSFRATTRSKKKQSFPRILPPLEKQLCFVVGYAPIFCSKLPGERRNVPHLFESNLQDPDFFLPSFAASTPMVYLALAVRCTAVHETARIQRRPCHSVTVGLPLEGERKRLASKRNKPVSSSLLVLDSELGSPGINYNNFEL